MTLSVAIRTTFTAVNSPAFHLDAEFEVNTGETLVLLGPSGSGKTLLLESVAGLRPHRGHVTLDGVPLTDKRPEHRGFGFVFQDYALFPHLRVRDNVAFGIRYHGSDADPDTIMQRLDIGHLAARYPSTLSGGEQQRVALARALVIQPRVLLLDEPLSSLDRPAREALRSRLTDVLANVTAIYVTHDRDEARILGDRIAVIRNGRIMQIGSPSALFNAPVDPFVAHFTGANCVALQDLPPACRSRLAPSGGEFLVIRPEDMRLNGAGGDRTEVKVSRVVPEGAQHRVTVSIGDTTLDVLTPASPPLASRASLELIAGKAQIL